MAASWSIMRRVYLDMGVKAFKRRYFERIGLPSLLHRQGSSDTKSKPRKDDRSKQLPMELEELLKEFSATPGKKKDTGVPLPAAYFPRYVEAAWYDWWMQCGFFSPDLKEAESKDVFSVILPPPNVTGTLHLGHALTGAIQDAIVRWQRMQGRQVVWVPGTDHAGIATQVVVERQLWRQRRQTRHDIGRDQFLQQVWQWKKDKGHTITQQMRRLGCSLDWHREYFTMDQGLSEAVVEAFVRLHEEGLLYRGERLVNWSCSLRSTISDIEVEDVVVEGRTSLVVPGYDKKVPFGLLSSFAYPVQGTGEEVVVSTTRLETMLGDVAVAVHPDDTRYAHLHGKCVVHPFTGRLLPIVCHTFVDRDFGTGAVKLTPGHSHTDLEVADQLALPRLTVMDESGHMINVPQEFAGLKRFDARRTVQHRLKERGLFRGDKEHAMTIPVCSRSKDIVEPLLKEQWFVRMEAMASLAVQAVEEGELTLVPQRHVSEWREWLSNIRDWCVSRQLWWGHRIPAYRVTSPELPEPLWVSGRSEAEARQKAAATLGCDSQDVVLKQDEDVLDTWFSSALLPFSVFGWPQQTADLRQLYPTSMLETGSDILFFWVARMVMLGVHLTGQLPFSQVLLHGILRDAHGRKMSKSLGNVVDPLHVIEGISLQELGQGLENGNLDPSEVSKAKAGQAKEFPEGIAECGADALRFTLCSYDVKAGEINMDVALTRANRHLCNKVWQSFRFVQSHLHPHFRPLSPFQTEGLSLTRLDTWVLAALSETVRLCQVGLTSLDLHVATQSLQSFWVSSFCDVYLECVKTTLASGSEEDKERVRQILHLCTETFLRALSPFMPFLTEELYQRLPAGADKAESVCVAPYPLPHQYPWADRQAEEEMRLVRLLVNRSLALRKDFNLTKSRADAFLVMKDGEMRTRLEAYRDCLLTLSRAATFTLTSDPCSIPAGTAMLEVVPGCQLHLKLEGLVEADRERDRWLHRRARLEEELDRLSRRLQALQAGTDTKALTKAQTKERELALDLERVDSVLSVLQQLSPSPPHGTGDREAGQ